MIVLKTLFIFFPFFVQILFPVEGNFYMDFCNPDKIGKNADPNKDEFLYGSFPDDFMWGFATSSYQIEGAWNIAGKGDNIWDNYTHVDDGKHIEQGHNGDVACDSYHKFELDVEALVNTGAHFYRFSISWARILPTGTLAGGINQEGIDYYNKLIDALLSKNIEPMVTMYHWDLPQALMVIGGWPNGELAPHFADYARILYQNYGSKVKYWITFNEPWVFCQLGWAYGSHAPGLQQAATEPYKCAHTLLRSHGKAYQIYAKEFKATQKGQVGITLDSGWSEPSDPSNPTHIEASNRDMIFKYGWFATPLITGDYPTIMRTMIDLKSEREGLPTSRLPTFTPEDKLEIKGTLDFFGLNHYSSGYVYPVENDGNPSWDGDKNVGGCGDPNWPPSAAPWLNVVPWGFRRVLKWIKDNYGNPPIYVTENGFADHDYDKLNDTGRINYYNLYINEMLKAIIIDGVNVKAYTAWSLIDNFEWAAGYTQRFGVHYVDFNDPDLKRVPKDSAKFLTKLFKDNGFFKENEENSASQLKSSSFHGLCVCNCLYFILFINKFFSLKHLNF